MWGANFDDNFNTSSFTISLIVMLYYFHFFKQAYKAIHPEREDENDFISKRYGYFIYFFNDIKVNCIQISMKKLALIKIFYLYNADLNL